MTHYAHLWWFFVLVFGVVLLPGLDMAFVLSSALTGGRRKGLAAVAGIIVGGVCHVVMTALGISMLLQLLPGAFNALLLAGALYIADCHRDADGCRGLARDVRRASIVDDLKFVGECSAVGLRPAQGRKRGNARGAARGPVARARYGVRGEPMAPP